MSLWVLASGSPRRREMLAWTGLGFTLHPVDLDETPHSGEPPADYVCRLAAAKAQAVIAENGLAAVIAADTTVADGEQILGKPADASEARCMLRRLRGRTHNVFTALTVHVPGHDWLHDLCCSAVPMRCYSDEELEVYVASGDPMDKAGAYAIQNRAFRPVTDFGGCFANVMGLPLCNLARTLRKAGIEPPADVPMVCQQRLAYPCPVHKAILAGQEIG